MSKNATLLDTILANNQLGSHFKCSVSMQSVLSHCLTLSPIPNKKIHFESNLLVSETFVEASVQKFVICLYSTFWLDA